MAVDIVRCPACGKSVAWAHTPTRPFCSRECKQRDLGNWATERYRIEADESPEEKRGETAENDEDEATPPRRR